MIQSICGERHVQGNCFFFLLLFYLSLFLPQSLSLSWCKSTPLMLQVPNSLFVFMTVMLSPVHLLGDVFFSLPPRTVGGQAEEHPMYSMLMHVCQRGGILF